MTLKSVALETGQFVRLLNSSLSLEVTEKKLEKIVIMDALDTISLIIIQEIVNPMFTLIVEPFVKFRVLQQ